MRAATLKAAKAGLSPKGDPFGPSRIAGILAAKQCPTFLPLCHPLSLAHVSVAFAFPAPEPSSDCDDHEIVSVNVSCTARAQGQTGVEMEALAGVSGALLCIYDMLKGMDKGMTLRAIQLERKVGGKSGDYRRDHD